MTLTPHLQAVRYFYTDPLAAAWMHRYFDMRLQVLVADNPPVFYRWSPKQPDLAWQDNRYYLHPDSLHLLEPKEGDFGKISVGWGATFRTFGKESGWWWGDDQMEMPCDAHTNFRDGKPFHWPESEAV